MGKSNPESQRTEYKSSWHDEYYKWICGYSNSNGGNLYVGVNDDGYVIGLEETRFLLDELPNQVVSSMGIVVGVDHNVAMLGDNLKYDVVPDDIATKPSNLYAVGTLTTKAVEEIDSSPDDIGGASQQVRALYAAAPALVRRLRKDAAYREKLLADIATWEKSIPTYPSEDGTLDYVCISVRPCPYGISYRGHYYQRSGGTTRELTSLELNGFLLERVGMHWDGMPMQGVSIEDLDPSAIEAYRRKAVSKGRHGESDVDVPDAQVISDLKLLDEGRGKDRALTRAAVLMFHAEPDRFVTGATVKVAYFAPAGAYGQNKADDIIYQDEVRGPVMTQADRVVDLVYTKYLKALTSYEGLQRLETYMTSREAFREIILNAINHKLYESGNPVQISVYDDRIVVFNQGKWPEDIDLKDIYTKKHSSYSHNPNLAKVFKESGEIEAYGSGFAKVRLECERHGAPLPEISVTPNGVTVTMRACDLYLKLLRYGRYWQTYPEFKSREVALLTDDEGEWITDESGAPLIAEATRELDPQTIASLDRMTETLASGLTDVEKERIAPIFSYLKEHATIDKSIAMQLTGKSSATATRYLKRLVGMGVLTPEGRARGRIYRRA